MKARQTHSKCILNFDDSSSRSWHSLIHSDMHMRTITFTRHHCCGVARPSGLWIWFPSQARLGALANCSRSGWLLVAANGRKVS